MLPNSRWLLSSFLFAILAVGAGIPALARDEPRATILAPAYFYPSGHGLKEWTRLLDAAAMTPIAAIVNPDSGPGKSRDSNYSELFRLAKNSRITMLGYVTLSYGNRPLSAVKADVDSWLFFYPDIQGIFFDEQPSQAEKAPFALESFAYARTKLGAGLLVTNPGVPCAQVYLAGRDAPTACLFEHETGFEQYQTPEWARAKGPRYVAILLYRVKTVDQMRKALSDSIKKGAGYLYVTDAPGPNPWNRLPTYWDEEIGEIVRINQIAPRVGKTAD